jgi:integrase
VKWIRPKPARNRILPSDLLDAAEVKRLVSAANHPRDRAMIAVLYESGARIGEILGLRIRDIVFDQHGALASVDGKTGIRRVRLVSSVPFLAEWLNLHPVGQPDSPVWCTKTGSPHAINYAVANQVLRTARARAGLRKPVNPHHFRHSRATFLASRLTEAQMKAHLGWIQASRMAAVYVHMSGRDVDSAILQLHGIAPAIEAKAEKLSQVTCGRCQMPNEYTNRWCKRCTFPLDREAEIELVQESLPRTDKLKLVDEVWEDDELRRKLLEKVRTLLE